MLAFVATFQNDSTTLSFLFVAANPRYQFIMGIRIMPITRRCLWHPQPPTKTSWNDESSVLLWMSVTHKWISNETHQPQCFVRSKFLSKSCSNLIVCSYACLFETVLCLELCPAEHVSLDQENIRRKTSQDYLNIQKKENYTHCRFFCRLGCYDKSEAICHESQAHAPVIITRRQIHAALAIFSSPDQRLRYEISINKRI